MSPQNLRPNPFKKNRDDPTLEARVLSMIGIGSTSLYLARSWMRKYDYKYKRLFRNFRVPVPTKKGMKEFLYATSKLKPVDAFEVVKLGDYRIEALGGVHPDNPLPNNDIIESISRLEKEISDLHDNSAYKIKDFKMTVVDSMKKYPTKEWGGRDVIFSKSKAVKAADGYFSEISDRFDGSDLIKRSKERAAKNTSLTEDSFSNLKTISRPDLIKYRKHLFDAKNSENNFKVEINKIWFGLKGARLLKPSGDHDWITVLERLLLSRGRSGPLFQHQKLLDLLDSRERNIPAAQDIMQSNLVYTKVPSYDANNFWNKKDNLFNPAEKGAISSDQVSKFMDFYKDAMRQRFVPDTVYSAVGDNRQERIKFRNFFKPMLGTRDPLDNVYKIIMKSADEMGIKINSVEPAPIDMPYSTKYNIKINFIGKRDNVGINREIIIPFIMSKRGMIQTDPKDMVKRFSLAKLGTGIEQRQLRFYTHKMKDWLSDGSKRATSIEEVRTIQNGIQSTIKAHTSKIFTNLEWASQNPLDNLNALFQVQWGAIIPDRLSDIQKGAIDHIEQLREATRANKNVMTFLDTEYDMIQGRTFMKEISVIVVKKTNNVWRVKKQYRAKINDWKSINMDPIDWSQGKYEMETSVRGKSPGYQKFGDARRDYNLKFGEFSDVLKKAVEMIEGPVVGSNVKGADIDALSKDIAKLRNRGVSDALKNLGRDLDKTLETKGAKIDNVFDANKIKGLTEGFLTGNLRGDTMEMLIDERLGVLDRKGMPARKWVDQIYKEVIGMERSLLIKNYDQGALTHTPHYDAMMSGIYTILMSFADVGNEREYITHAFKKLANEIAGMEALGFVSPTKISSSIMTFLNPRTFIPFYDRVNQQRAYPQMGSLLPLGRTGEGANLTHFLGATKDSASSLIPRLFVGGSEDLMAGLSDYSRYSQFLLLDTPQTAESQLMIDKKFPMGKMGYYTKEIKVDVIDHSIVKGARLYKGKVIGGYRKPGTVLGIKNDSDVKYSEPLDAIVKSVDHNTGKILVEMDPYTKLGKTFWTLMGKVNLAHMSDIRNVNFIMKNEAFQRENVGILFNTYFGRLIYIAERNPEHTKTIKKAINDHFKEYVRAEVDKKAGYLKIVVTPGHKDLDWAGSDFIYKLGQVYRQLGITQDKFQSYWETHDSSKAAAKGLFIGNSPQNLADPVKLTKEGMNAVRDWILRSTRDPDNDSYKFLRDFAFEGNNKMVREKKLQSFRTMLKDSGWKSKSRSEMHKEFLKIANIKDPFRIHSDPKHIFLGFPTYMMWGFPSMEPLFGLGKEPGGLGKAAKINQLVLSAVEKQPGAAEFYNWLREYTIVQSAPRLGEVRTLFALNKLKLPEPLLSAYDDYVKIASEGEGVLKVKNIQKAALKALKARPSAAKALADIVEPLYNIRGKLYTESAALSDLSDIYNVTDLAKYERYDTKSFGKKAYFTKDLEFFRRDIKPLRITTPKNNNNFLDPSNTAMEGVINQLFFASGESYIVKTNRPDISLLTEKGQTLMNLLSKIKAGGDFVPGWRGIVEQYLDLRADMTFKDNFYSYLPDSMSGFTQMASPVVRSNRTGGFLDIERIHETDKALAHEVIINKKWISDHAGILSSATERMTFEDMKYLVKYMRNYDKTVYDYAHGGNPLGRHPMWEHLSKRKVMFGGKKIGVDSFSQKSGAYSSRSFFGQIMRRDLKLGEISKYRKTWADLVSKGGPMPIMLSRQPVINYSTIVPAVGFVRDLSKSRGGGVLDSTFAISSLLAKYLGADYDADTTYIHAAPYGFKSWFTGALSEGYYNEMAELKGLGGFYSDWAHKTTWDIYDPRKGGIIRVGEKGLVDAVSSEVKEATGKSLETIYNARDMREQANMMKKFIKMSPGLTTKMIVTFENLFSMINREQGLRPSQKYMNSLYRRIQTLTEWGLKQKGTSAAHPTPFIIRDIEEIYKKGSVKNLNTILTTYRAKIGMAGYEKFPKTHMLEYDGMPGVDDAHGNMLTKYKWLYEPKDYNDTLGKLLNENFTDKPYAEFIINEVGAKRLNPKDLTFIDLVRAIEGKYPNVMKYTPALYKMMSRTGTLRDLMREAHGGIKFPHGVGAFVDMGGVVTPVTNQERLMGSVKKSVEASFGKVTVKNVQEAAGMAGMLALGYFALNLFQPNQMKSLGNIPGRGGEIWDYQFANNEMDYEQFMNVPLGNPFDLPKAYLNLFGPNDILPFEKNRYREKPSYAMRSAGGIKSKHSRSFYYSSGLSY